jgi:hypothetical protein
VLSLAIIFAFFIRNDNDKEAGEFIDEDNFELDDDEDYLHSNEVS